MPLVDIHVFALTLPIIHGFLLAMCSNTCIFQGPVGSPIEVETEVRDSIRPPPADIVLSPQQQTEFQNDSLVTSQNLASQPPLYANVADENALAIISTPDDIRLIKHKNLVEALRKFQQIHRLSTDAPPPSTTSVIPQCFMPRLSSSFST